MPRIFVSNKSGFGHFGDVEIVLDGRDQLKLSRNESADFTVPPGVHTLQARSGSLFSSPVEFRAADRESLGFSCSASGLWNKQLLVESLYHRPAADRFGSPLPPKTEQTAPATVKSDWAALLNVTDTASMDEIRRAYLKLIWKYHPDRVVNLTAEERLAAEHAARAVNIAYAAAKKLRRKSR